MEVRRVTAQGPETVAQTYQQMIGNCESVKDRRRLTLMLDLLDELSAHAPGVVVWGLTSHERLALNGTDSDEFLPPSPVFISPLPDGWYIECALPAKVCPWPEAVVMGRTRELSEAVRRVLLGLRWAGVLDQYAGA